jgi:hypothetical protein
MKIPVWAFGLAVLAAVQLPAREYSPQEILALAEAGPAVLEARAAAAESAARAVKEGRDFMDAILGYNLMELGLGDAFSPDMLVHKFSLKQDLPTSGRLKHAGAAARKEAQGAEAGAQALIRERRKMILTLVSDWAWGGTIASNRRREAGYLRNLLDLARTQYVSGAVNYAVLSELEIKSVQAENMALDFEKENGLRLIELQNLAGLRDPDFSLKPSVFPTELKELDRLGVEALYKAYLEANPERRMRSLELERLNDLRDKAASSFIPDLGLMTEFNYRPGGGSTFGLGLEINISGLSLEAKQAELSAAEKAVQRTQAALARAELETFHRLQSLLLRIKSQARQLEQLAGRALKVGEENVTHMLQEFQLQKADLASVFGAVRMAFEVRDQYAVGLGRVYADLFELEALTGQKYYSF